MKTLERACSSLSDIAAFAGGLALVMMMLQITVDVLGKYLFNAPVPATLETVSSYYMVALVFLPLGQVTRQREHIEVELFTQHLSPRKLAGVTALASMIGLIYVGILAWRSMDEAIYMTEIRESWGTELWDMQVWPTRWFVTVGCVLMAFYLLLHAIDDWAYAISGRRLLDAVNEGGPQSPSSVDPESAR
ncbi:TRAP transporter small permease [Oceanibacterium hippocampi]|uniref:TRAP transporter small permease protein n=1 Tax=Oceanibacterium hippocampi TaxID=745714 RepID=A0A1Y5TLX2_9PROT|nr:TRAP transporter small permease [Oceanibacterium hippocampi]SLN67126.1 Tripartite ATP-independent periplasmic transporters, DctQ component [Oceanibacterium hippocampi]